MKIVAIEDQAMVRGLIVRACHDAFPSAKISEAGDGAHGLELCRSFRPQLILLDIDLPDIDGLDLVPDLKVAAPAAKILIITSHTDAYSLNRIQGAGVQGLVDKNEQSPEILYFAVRELMAGRAYFSGAVHRARVALRSDPKSFDKLLSEREQRLLKLFGRGMGNDEVAKELGLAENTVRNHRRNIMGKLEIHSTPELIRYAIGKGFTRVRADG